MDKTSFKLNDYMSVQKILTEFVTKVLYVKNRRRGSNVKKFKKKHVQSSKTIDTSQTRSRMSLEHYEGPCSENERLG